jgi:predicted Fe-Mo cluster-binding NifX family protein
VRPPTILLALLLAFMLLWPASTSASDPLRFAVATTGGESDSAISPEAARAPFILIFDHRGELAEVIRDRTVPTGGAGPETARLLQGKKVTHFLAKEFGPKLVQALDQAGIKHVEGQGPAREAVLQLIKELGPPGES